MSSAKVVIGMSWKCVYLSVEKKGEGRMFGIYISTCDNTFSKPRKWCS